MILFAYCTDCYYRYQLYYTVYFIYILIIIWYESLVPIIENAIILTKYLKLN